MKDHTTHSILGGLRATVPERQMAFLESLQIAELQAARLRELLGYEEGALPESAIAALPHIRVVRRRLPTSGMSYWSGREWVIALNAREPEARQRFTLLHEYKHVLDHGRTANLYVGSRAAAADQQAEQAADYFAGCALMPKRLLKRAWTSGRQTPEAVAEQFDVSARAAEVRLAQVGLTDDTERCRHVDTYRNERRGRYFRRPTRATRDAVLT